LGGKQEEKVADLKGYDDFQKKKYHLNQFLTELRPDIERLIEMKRNLAAGTRDTNAIKLTNDNHRKLQSAKDQWNALKQQLQKDEKRRAKIGEKDWQDRVKMVQVLGQEIIDLQNKNARVRSQEGDLEKTIRTRRDERESKRREERQRQKAEGGGRRGRRGRRGDEEDAIDDIQPVSQQEIEFMEFKDKAIAEQDELLSDLSAGMDELLAIGQDMQKNLKIQNAMLETVEEKVDLLNEKFQTANQRLKEILDSTGGAGLWVPRIICIVVLLALVAYLFKVVEI